MSEQEQRRTGRGKRLRQRVRLSVDQRRRVAPVGCRREPPTSRPTSMGTQRKERVDSRALRDV